jgi:signal transduction histidine kinase
MTARPANGPLLKLPYRVTTRPVWQVMTRALERLRQGNEHGVLVARGSEPFDIVAGVDALAEAIDHAMEDDAPAQPPTTLGVAARQLLDALRRLFVEELASNATNVELSDVVRLLSVMERLQRELDGIGALQFSTRLTGPDAMQLLVEVVHDMRSPLNAILLLAEQLRSGRSGPLVEIQLRQMDLVHSAAFGLTTLADDVIELAHGGNRLVDERPMPFAISSVLKVVGDLVQPLATEKQIQLLSSGPEADVRVGHRVAVGRVLLNLTTNAVKFTEQGSVTIACEQKTRTRLEFSVTDTGRGIPPDALPTLFDPFRQRANRSEYAFSSSGLGLSICQQLVMAMGGELTVETELGKGTRFSFVLDLPLSPRVSGAW